MSIDRIDEIHTKWRSYMCGPLEQNSHPNLLQDMGELLVIAEALRDALIDGVSGLNTIDGGEWNEYTGALVLKEDEWGSIREARDQLRAALAKLAVKK